MQSVSCIKIDVIYVCAGDVFCYMQALYIHPAKRKRNELVTSTR